MHIALIIIFVLAYAAIAFEHPLNLNKSAVALVASGVLWMVYALTSGEVEQVANNLHESVSTTAEIVFFLMGAITIVEVIDAHNGFEVITSRIKTRSLNHLLWQVGLATFFLSAVLDNLTTTVVMISMVKKLIDDQADRLYFAGIVIIAANAGGAWSPIGDVTTTMLWIGGQITSVNIMRGVFLPSLACLLVPLTITGLGVFRGRAIILPVREQRSNQLATPFEQNVMFAMGIGTLLTIPILHEITALPPFMGILLGLGLLWLTGDILHRHKDEESGKEQLSIASALQRIDMSCVVFFIGILLSVAVLEHTNILAQLSRWLQTTFGREDIIVPLIGLASAIVDNVPLVAASMGMYNLAAYPPDNFLWEFMAYCAGTGGSILIIGSAAGVAAMGLEKIHFLWYARKFGPLAFLGYCAGIIVYIAQHRILH